MVDPKNFLDDEDEHFHGWFTSLREYLPTLHTDLSSRVVTRLAELEEEDRLSGPAPDGILKNLTIQLVNLLTGWFNRDDDDPRDP